MNPFYNNLVVIPDGNPTRSEGGIILPDSHHETASSGIVEKLGPNCNVATEGMKVHFKRHSEYRFNVDGVEKVLVNEDNLLFWEAPSAD